MSEIDILKAIHNNDYNELLALSKTSQFKEYLTNPMHKIIPIWAVKKDDTLFNKDLFTLLVDNGAIIDLTNKYGQTLLMYSIECGYIKLAKALIECDCDLNIQDKAGMTALHYAIYNLDVEMINILLLSDTDKTCKDNCGKTAYYYLINNVRHQHILEEEEKKKKCIQLFKLYTE